MNKFRVFLALAIAFVALLSGFMNAQNHPLANPYADLMRRASEDARRAGAPLPVLSPNDETVTPDARSQKPVALVPVSSLHAMGVKVIPWTTNDPERMRTLIRAGVDGIITDRPDILQQVLQDEIRNGSADERARLAHFDVAAHRGGRGLRPENTLPSFESGLDQLSTTLETDTGVSTDRVSTIWHDQFYSPQSCRRADGEPYTTQNLVYLRDISSTQAQRMFVCDKLRFGHDQKNDLSLSPVAVAFAAKERMLNPYAPTNVDQLFRFVRFYADYYRSGAGKSQPHSAERATNAGRVRFNLETKLVPDDYRPPDPSSGPEFRNHTVSPEIFVQTLAGTIERHHMANRCEIQSFDFRTLLLTTAHYPSIPTYYLTGDPASLWSNLLPEALRLTKP